MRESRTYGSVRGALSNVRPYRNLCLLQIVYLAKAKRIIASPKANVNPYPKLSI